MNGTIPFYVLHWFYLFLFREKETFSNTWYSQFCWNTCFENANLFQYDRYMMEQFEHNANFTFAYVWFCLWETWGEHRFLPAKPSHLEIHNPHSYQFLQFAILYTTPISYYNSYLILDNIPCTTSEQHPQTPTLLPQWTSGLLMETCHINCHVMYLNHLTCVKLCYHHC